MYGAERDRTDDLQSAILALSQLSYNPIKRVMYIESGAERDRTDDLQSAILALSQLSYNPTNSAFAERAV